MISEGCKKKMISRWKKTSSSTRLLCFMVPLVLVSGILVALCGGGGSLSFGFVTNYTSSSSLAPLGVSEVNYSSLSLPIVENNVTGSLGNDAKDDKNLTTISSVDYVVQTVEDDDEERQLPVIKEQENINDTTTTLRTDNIIPSLNETHETIPQRPRIERRFSNLEKLEARLGRARAAIRAARNGNQTYDPDYMPVGPIYWNSNIFHRSYLEMEKQFKIYMYDEGEPPMFHNGPCKSIYAMEGNFIYHMETTQFRTRDPEKANMFFLSMSVTQMVHFIYDGGSHEWHPMRQVIRDYVHLVAGKYPYWNRSNGADHFMVACHDWGPELSKSVPELYKNSIRGLCNANTSEGFNPSKDVSFPEIHLPGGNTKGLIGGPSPSQRQYLAFFAGGLHGPVRPILLEHWEDKDEDVQVHKYLKKGVSYYGMMRNSKYCICPSGYEVASPRLVEALYTGCVPVLINDHYVPPFSDVLNWKAFSVEVPVKEIPNLKTILTGISSSQYVRLQRRGKQVRRHFEVNLPPQRYDVFHMILHSVWLRRLNLRIHGVEDI
ncbi:hypothetical protein Leryth_000930 [Lithospermum erythrorhizon]|uniref:Glycosyltransferase n=1 Tax=Lithospermum erythrorhizon TaxID=34254 RepID=A0AAV3PN16_LITER|nr:hypothetical protein Leryth_000930 [Lithospermum erythrorhizon]